VHQGVLKNIINEYTYSENLTNNKFRAQAKSEIPKYNEDVLTDNDCNYESEITKNRILALDEIKRKLFTDNEMENVQKAINITSMVIFKPSAPNLFQNKNIYTSLCFKCTNNLSRSQYGAKCAKCSRTFDIKCILKDKTRDFSSNSLFMCNVCTTQELPT
jgi:hypothetical protein